MNIIRLHGTIRTIDDIDTKILHILQEKARIPNAEVARQVGMAPSAVLERIRKLEERGIIEGYEVRLNPAPFGQGLAAFVFVRRDRAGNGSLAGELAGDHRGAGGPPGRRRGRLPGQAAGRRTPTLGRILRDEFMAVDGVRSTRTQIVLNTVKETRRIDLTEP